MVSGLLGELHGYKGQLKFGYCPTEKSKLFGPRGVELSTQMLFAVRQVMYLGWEKS